MFRSIACAAALACAALSSAQAADAPGGTETGLAAVYNDKLHGRKTASGQRYDRNAATAAHKTLPFGTQVKITNLKNKRSTSAHINDRGPTQADRVLDVSPRVARELGISKLGMAEVRVEVAQAAKARK